MEGESSAETMNGEKSGGGRTREDQIAGRRLDDVFDALADGRRRLALQYFRNCSDDVATLTDLAVYVAKRAEGSDFQEVSIALHHKDVPKLAAVGLVEYDPRTETVEFVGPEFVYALLDKAGDRIVRDAGGRSVVDSDAVGHLYDALSVDDPVEKDYLVRQALQHIHVERQR